MPLRLVYPPFTPLPPVAAFSSVVTGSAPNVEASVSRVYDNQFLPLSVLAPHGGAGQSHRGFVVPCVRSQQPARLSWHGGGAALACQDCQLRVASCDLLVTQLPH